MLHFATGEARPPGQEERRRAARRVEPHLSIRINDGYYQTLNWSLVGLLVAGNDPLPDQPEHDVTFMPLAPGDPSLTVRMTIVRRDPERGQMALTVKELSEDMRLYMDQAVMLHLSDKGYCDTERRHAYRQQDPALSIKINGHRYKANNWSLTGLSIADYYGDHDGVIPLPGRNLSMQFLPTPTSEVGLPAEAKVISYNAGLRHLQLELCDCNHSLFMFMSTILQRQG